MDKKEIRRRINQAYLDDDPDLAEELEVKEIYQELGGNIKDVESAIRRFPLLIESCIKLGRERLFRELDKNMCDCKKRARPLICCFPCVKGILGGRNSSHN